MNIYFACSITGGRAYQSVYKAIVRALLAEGVEVPTAHLAETGVVNEEKIVAPETVYARDAAWMRAADALVAEVSVPSHGVGYEIGFALGLGKPVLCLYERERPVSKMITGNPDPRLQVIPYSSAEDAVRIVLEFAQGMQHS
jgi:2'-deoxynucleoside 5'-phosphate N-hydrolase